MYYLLAQSLGYCSHRIACAVGHKQGDMGFLPEYTGYSRLHSENWAAQIRIRIYQTPPSLNDALLIPQSPQCGETSDQTAAKTTNRAKIPVLSIL